LSQNTILKRLDNILKSKSEQILLLACLVDFFGDIVENLRVDEERRVTRSFVGQIAHIILMEYMCH